MRTALGSKEAAVVADTALAAGRVLLEMQGSVRRIESQRDFVTNADVRSEEAIRVALRAYFGDALAIYSEEGGGPAEADGDLAVIDALDGTANYAWGDRIWAVSIAITRQGKTRVGVVYAPRAERLYVAYRDVAQKFNVAGGTTLESTPAILLSPTRNAELKNSRVDTDWIKGNPERVFQILRVLNARTIYPNIRTCCTVQMMRVAAGELDGYVMPGPQPEDMAAAGLIVENAGGRVTNLRGEPYDIFSGEVMVATNGLIHEKLLRVLR